MAALGSDCVDAELPSVISRVAQRFGDGLSLDFKMEGAVKSCLSPAAGTVFRERDHKEFETVL